MDHAYRRLSKSGTGVDKLLGELEAEVMAVLWQRGGGAVRDVLVELNECRPSDRHLAYTTVMTVMARLADKGLLRRIRVGKAHTYTVAESREEFVARATRQLAQRMVTDFGEAAVASFLSELQQVAPERLEALRRQVKDRDPR